MRRQTVTVIALAVATLAGCGGGGSAPAPARAEPEPVSASLAGRACPVTLPHGDVPDGFDYGDRSLAVALWPRGRLLAGRRPDGSSWAEIAADGSIEAKLGWWRGAAGQLTIQGSRLDAPAPPLRADVPAGYGSTGFQATGLTFPTVGCWKVVGRVADARLTFVVLVRKRGRS